MSAIRQCTFPMCACEIGCDHDLMADSESESDFRNAFDDFVEPDYPESKCGLCGQDRADCYFSCTATYGG